MSLASSARIARIRRPPPPAGRGSARTRARTRRCSSSRRPPAARTPPAAPAKTSRPSCSTTRRSACVCASSTFCVAKTTAPPRPVTPRRSSHSRARWRGSRLAVGSSRNTTAGSATSPIATFRRCTLPTDSSCAGRSAASSRSTCASRRSATSCGSLEPLELGEQAQVLARAQLAVERGPLRHPAACAPAARSIVPSVVSAAPASSVRRVVLPAPFGPSSATLSPARTSRSIGARAIAPGVAAAGPARRDEHAGGRRHAAFPPWTGLPFEDRICSRPAPGRLRRDTRWATIPPRSRRPTPPSAGGARTGCRGIGSRRCRCSARAVCGLDPDERRTRHRRSVRRRRLLGFGLAAIVAAVTLGLTLSGHDPTPVAADPSPVSSLLPAGPPVPAGARARGLARAVRADPDRPHLGDRLPPGRRQPLVLARPGRAGRRTPTCSTRSGATSSATAAAASATTSPTAARTRSTSARAPARTCTPRSTARSSRSRPT